MDCERFERSIDLLSSGAASMGASAAAEIHLRECPRCRALYGAEAQGHSAPQDSPDFSRAVLASTTGPVCPAAAQAMCASFDGRTDDARMRLLELHSSTCPDCRELEAAMHLLRRVLPQMACLDPGEEFTAGVVAATRGIPVVRPRRWSSPARLWDNVVRRPLFAWEAAYAGTLLFALLFLNPLLPVRSYSARAIAEVHETAVTAVEPAEAAARQLATNAAARLADRRIALGEAFGSWTGRARTLLHGTLDEVRGRLRSGK